MVNYMEELSVTEAENLKKTISALFRQTCILQVKYDPVTLTPRDNLHYEICVRHREIYRRLSVRTWVRTGTRPAGTHFQADRGRRGCGTFECDGYEDHSSY